MRYGMILAVTGALTLGPLVVSKGGPAEDTLRQAVDGYAVSKQAEVDALQKQVDSLQLELAAARNTPRSVYVSSSSGRDDLGDGSPAAPFKTIAKGWTQMRDGRNDRLLLKRGDVWEEPLHGNLKLADVTVSAYGAGPRPVVRSPGTALQVLAGSTLKLFAMEGVRLTCKGRDPALPGFDASAQGTGVRVVGRFEDFSLYDCVIDHFQDNLTFEAPDGGEWSKGLSIRNCYVLDSWSRGGQFSGQGLYFRRTAGVVIDGCVFDHNGWLADADKNIYRHNIYGSEQNSDVALSRTVLSRAASHGAQLRDGAVVTDCLFVDNAVHLVGAGDKFQVLDSVFIGGHDINAANPRGFGVSLEASDNLVQGCLILRKPFDKPKQNNGAALTVERGDHTPAGAMKVRVSGVVVDTWNGNGLQVSEPCDLAVSGSVFVLDGQDVVGSDGKKTTWDRSVLAIDAKPTALALDHNVYFSPRDKAKWFRWDKTTTSGEADYRARTGDLTSVMGPPPRYANPAADALSPGFYDLARGGGLSLPVLLDSVRAGFKY